MIKIVLPPGETVRVELSDTDGHFDIRYDEIELTVTAELSGSHKGEAGVIYREVFAGCTCEADFADGAMDPKCPEHGEYSPKAIRVE